MIMAISEDTREDSANHQPKGGASAVLGWTGNWLEHHLRLGVGFLSVGPGMVDAVAGVAGAGGILGDSWMILVGYCTIPVCLHNYTTQLKVVFNYIKTAVF